MSIKLMSLVYASGLDKGHKAIALAYADHADDNGKHIYPSVGYMAWKTGYSDRSVQIITKELVKLSVLVRDGRGPKGTNRYRMNSGALPKRKKWGGEEISGGRSSQHEGVKLTAEKGEVASPNPSLIIKETSDGGDFADLVRYFSKHADKEIPNLETKSANKFWLQPLIYIYKHHASDYDETKRAIYAAINHMKDNSLTIATPKSIRNVATAGRADKTGDYIDGVLAVASR